MPPNFCWTVSLIGLIIGLSGCGTGPTCIQSARDEDVSASLVELDGQEFVRLTVISESHDRVAIPNIGLGYQTDGKSKWTIDGEWIDPDIMYKLATLGWRDFAVLYKGQSLLVPISKRGSEVVITLEQGIDPKFIQDAGRAQVLPWSGEIRLKRK